MSPDARRLIDAVLAHTNVLAPVPHSPGRCEAMGAYGRYACWACGCRDRHAAAVAAAVVRELVATFGDAGLDGTLAGLEVVADA